MTSSNRSLSDFLMEQDFVKLKEEALRKKREDHKRAMEEVRQREEEAKRKAMEKAITPDDVKMAEKRGYDRGFEDGKQDARQKMADEFRSHMQSLDDKLESHDEIARKYLALLIDDATEMAQIVLNYIMDDVAHRYPKEMVRKALERGLQEVNKEAELLIFVNPASQIYMADIAKDLLKKRSYKMKDDPKLPMGGCRIEWEGCGHHSALETVHKDMQALMDGFRQGIHPDKVELPELEGVTETKKISEEEKAAAELKEKDPVKAATEAAMADALGGVSETPDIPATEKEEADRVEESVEDESPIVEASSETETLEETVEIAEQPTSEDAPKE